MHLHDNIQFIFNVNESGEGLTYTDVQRWFWHEIESRRVHVVTHGEMPVSATFVACTEDSRGDFTETPVWQENYLFTMFLMRVFCYVTKILLYKWRVP
jgi:hypothetical protein